MSHVPFAPKPGIRKSPLRRARPGLDPGPGPNFLMARLGPGLRRDDGDSSTDAVDPGSRFHPS